MRGDGLAQLSESNFRPSFLAPRQDASEFRHGARIEIGIEPFLIANPIKWTYEVFLAKQTLGRFEEVVWSGHEDATGLFDIRLGTEGCGGYKLHLQTHDTETRRDVP